MAVEPNNKVRIYKLKSWDDFIACVRASGFAADRIFRGHSKPTWKLSSTWERLLDRMKDNDPSRNVRALFGPGSFDQFRDSYIEKFKDLAIGLPNVDTQLLSEEEWLMLARHSGLVTPLLDWTRSPFVAAYHAFADLIRRLNPGFALGTNAGVKFANGIVTVWELVMDDTLSIPREFEVVAIRAPFAHRQRAQQGIATQLTHDVHVDLEAYLKSRGAAHFLGRYDIPAQEMGKALWDLQLMNINPATLFPELSGAAEMANTLNSIYNLGIHK